MNHEDCYKEMYLSLTQEVANTIDRLQSIQQQAEECYIYAKQADIYAMPTKDQIRHVSDIQNNYDQIASYCIETGEPVFLIQNGELSLVVLSKETYKKQVIISRE